ncbi:MAG: GIDE domain-containing protein [Candidatus Omnitrophota bacterium]
MHTSSEFKGFFYALIFFGFGIWYFFWGFKRLRRKRLIENIPTSTIRGLAMGLVELSGRAKKSNVLKSPFSKIECVLYRYTIERYESRGKSGSWVNIAKGDSFYCPFTIDDGTGSIMVLPSGAELILPTSFEFTSGWFRSTPPSLIEFMDQHGVPYRGIFGGNYSLRFREWCIPVERTVYVLGVAKKSHDIGADHKERLMHRIWQIKQDPAKMKEFDSDKDGSVSIEEWDKAVKKIEQDLLEEELKSASDAPLGDVVIGQADTERTFLISQYSQRDLVKKLGWQSFGGIFGGAALALLMLFCLLWLLIFDN